MDLMEIERKGVDWVPLSEMRDRSREHGNEPSVSIKGGEFLD
jgi:hypothetical protein